MRVNLKQLVLVGGRFYCCLKDFSHLDPSCRRLHCLLQWFHHSFFLVGDVAKSLGVGRV